MKMSIYSKYIPLQVAGCEVPEATRRSVASFIDLGAYRSACAELRLSAQVEPSTAEVDTDSATAPAHDHLVPRRPDLVDIHSFVEGDGMVDAFAYFFPNAKGRATCWFVAT